MADTANEALVRRGYEAFSKGDMDTLAGIMADTVVHRVAGDNLTSGEHKGQDAVFAMYGQLFELSGGTLAVEIEEVRADGEDRVVAIHRATGERKGSRLDVRQTIVFTIDGGEIVELDETSDDQAAEDAFWV